MFTVEVKLKKQKHELKNQFHIIYTGNKHFSSDAFEFRIFLLNFFPEGELQYGDDRQLKQYLYDQNGCCAEVAPEDRQGCKADGKRKQMDHQDRLRTGQAHLDKTVGNMVVVTDPERFFVERSDDDHHGSVKEGERQHQQRDQDGEA